MGAETDQTEAVVVQLVLCSRLRLLLLGIPPLLPGGGLLLLLLGEGSDPLDGRELRVVGLDLRGLGPGEERLGVELGDVHLAMLVAIADGEAPGREVLVATEGEHDVGILFAP